MVSFSVCIVPFCAITYFTFSTFISWIFWANQHCRSPAKCQAVCRVPGQMGEHRRQGPKSRGAQGSLGGKTIPKYTNEWMWFVRVEGCVFFVDFNFDRILAFYPLCPVLPYPRPLPFHGGFSHLTNAMFLGENQGQILFWFFVLELIAGGITFQSSVLLYLSFELWDFFHGSWLYSLSPGSLWLSSHWLLKSLFNSILFYLYI